MIAIDNSELKAYCRNCNCANVVPALTYAYDAAAKTVTVTSASTIGSPDGLKIIHINVHDQYGNSVYGKIQTISGNVVISTATLDASKPYSITATLVSNGGCLADGSAKNIGAAGALGGWDKNFSEADAITPLDPEPDPDPIETDKTALQAEIDDVIALNEADYTPATWATLETALSAAIEVLGDAGATQTEIDNALADLTAAVAALVAV
jgi:hypothetical protein